ncbi:hypothetical protein F5051DRAFT_440964 [Lentinula edodes]|nr:hypothetical protein F5051DRAFT_440964 [Lentinula edodes]
MSLPSSSAATGAPNPVLPPMPLSMSWLTPLRSPLYDSWLYFVLFSASVYCWRDISSTILFGRCSLLLGSLALFVLEARKRQIVQSSPTLLVVVTATTRSPVFWVGLPAFVIFHWRGIAAKIEASTNSTVALIELNSLDEQDQQELDCLELGELLRKQPQLPRPSTTTSLPSPIPSIVATPRALAKKRKRSIRQEEGGSSSLHKRPVREVSEPEVAPGVHDRKRKRPVGESR